MTRVDPTHPEIVERVWDELGKELPKDGRCLVYGRPALVQPASGVVLAMAMGTSYALRIPQEVLAVALTAGYEQSHTYGNGQVTDLSAKDLQVRGAVYSRFANGGVPAVPDIAADLAIDVAEVRDAYERLAIAHVLVLDPGTRELWMAMPFSAVPTAFQVEGLGRQWFANCAWDAFGIAAAMACDVTITTDCLDCGAPMTYGVRDGELTNRDGVVHFAVPARRWWDDIGLT